jgi:aspartate/methionine/tyrosine aminotransferase
MTACFDTGDRIGLVEPGYPCYRAMAVAGGFTPVRIGVGPETRYAPTAEQMRAEGPLAGLFIAHPQNPTGTALTPRHIADLDHAAEELGCRLIVDEIYRDLSFVGPLPTMAGRDHGEIIVSSFSKYFSMTGWRLGWMVVPPDLIGAVDRLAQNLYLAPPTISQVAALAALDQERLGTWDATSDIERYRTNRDALIALAAELGATAVAPADGAFYVYAQLPELTTATGGSLNLARRWLDEAGVAVAPGIDFDRISGDRWVRFSAAGAVDEIAEGARRLASWDRSAA